LNGTFGSEHFLNYLIYHFFKKERHRIRSVVRLNTKRGFTQNEAWFCSKPSVVLLKTKRGFVQNEAWFYSKPSVVFVRGKLGFCSSVICK